MRRAHPHPIAACVEGEALIPRLRANVMQLAYRALSLPDAQLVADLLRTVGIDAHIFNQNAQSAAGEIPPAVAYPQVWVVQDSQLARARALIAEFFSRPAPGIRFCSHCGEENPSNFLSCWACRGDL